MRLQANVPGSADDPSFYIAGIVNYKNLIGIEVACGCVLLLETVLVGWRVALRAACLGGVPPHAQTPRAV